MNETFKILLVGSMPAVRKIFQSMPLYAVDIAADAKDAVRLIAREYDYRVCILAIDETNEIEVKEPYLLKHFGRRIPCVILTSSKGRDFAAHYKEMGAKGVYGDNSNIAGLAALVKSVNRSALLSYLRSLNMEFENYRMRVILDALLQYNPELLLGWAEKAGMTRYYMIRLYNHYLLAQHRQVVEKYRLLRKCMKRFEMGLLSNSRRDPRQSSIG
jgi:hypothetical protein